jgi:putative ABC transport system permease protein
MSYALTILWHDRVRFFPGVLVTAFSALLVALQCGLLLGMLAFASIPVDHATADIWVGAAGLVSVDLGSPIGEGHLAELAVQPEVAHCEAYLESFGYWRRRDGNIELCMVIGSRLTGNALGAVHELTPELRARLSEPGAVVVDESDLGRLGIRGPGDVTEINGSHVRVVGMVHGLRSFIGAYVFCSIETARSLLHLMPDQTIYLLARCHDPADAQRVVERLRAAKPGLSWFTRAELSARSRFRWLTMTKAGIALGYAAAVGLAIGAFVTGQTLHAATAGSIREFAVLRALGIPLWRSIILVAIQSCLVGAMGVILSLPAIFALSLLADRLSISVLLPGWLLASTAAVIVSMALVSSLNAVRLLRGIEPGLLLR